MDIIKEEEAVLVPSPILSRHEPAEGCGQSQQKRKQVTFIDLTENNESYRSLMPPPALSSSRSVLDDKTSHANVSFVLDYHPAQIMEPSKERSSISSETSTKMRTSAITLLDTNHGRQRRQERAIPRREIQAAIKYGKVSACPGDGNKLIYEYQGKKHVVTREERLLVTSMVKTVVLTPKLCSDEDRRKNDRHYSLIRHEQKNDWNSHSVLIVDRSGSMRNSDVNGCRTRLGAVWLSIAKDFIEYRLESGMANSMVRFYLSFSMCHSEIVYLQLPPSFIGCCYHYPHG